MSDVLDLDALQPQSKSVKFNDKIIEVQPPKTGDLLRLSQIGAKMQEAANLPAEELDKVVSDLEAAIKKMIPELADATLVSGQLMSLLTLVMEMGMPEQMAELKKKGIEVTPSKKALQE